MADIIIDAPTTARECEFVVFNGERIPLKDARRMLFIVDAREDAPRLSIEFLGRRMERRNASRE